jgi:hypothetical protein
MNTFTASKSMLISWETLLLLAELGDKEAQLKKERVEKLYGKSLRNLFLKGETWWIHLSYPPGKKLSTH